MWFFILGYVLDEKLRKELCAFFFFLPKENNNKRFIFINAADKADDIQADDDGEETNDEEEFLNEQDTELLDEGNKHKLQFIVKHAWH